MKSICLLFSLCFAAKLSYPQDTIQKKETTNTISAYSYVDLNKSDFQSVFWTSYDHNKFSIEARYNYDWDKTVSLYAGAVLKHKDWKFRLMQGITTGNGNTGLVISPLSIYNGKKIFIYNSPQVVFSIANMPTYFFHWGEIYYKPADFFWFGLADRISFDNEGTKDINFGPQVSFVYKELFLNFYYWLPPSHHQFSILLGYERSFKRQRRNK